MMVGLGELLWDLLPTGKTLGGAPANFAYMANLFGNRGIIASRVGPDGLGREACDVIAERGLETRFVQQDDSHETGFAGILLNQSGEPNFTINKPAAWDYFEWTPLWEELAATADVVCFGSLAQRMPTSATTIEKFLRSTSADALKICDANLRNPFYSTEILTRSFTYADVLKLNEAELHQIGSLLKFRQGDLNEVASALLHQFGLRLVCITRGFRGSVMISKDEVIEHAGIPVEVADTIGAGDAFTACVAHCLIHGYSLKKISDSANRLAAWVTTQAGATPTMTEAQLIELTGVGVAGRVSAPQAEVSAKIVDSH